MAFLSGINPAFTDLFGFPSGGTPPIYGGPQNDAQPAEKPRRRRGLFGGLLGGGGGLPIERLMAAQAIAQGDYGAALQLRSLQQRQRQAETEAEQAREATASRAEAAQALGISKEQLNAMRPEDISSLLESRFQSRQFGPEGGTVRNVDPTGQATYDQAPWQRQIGRGIIGGGPNGAPPREIYQGVEPVPVQQGGAVYGWNNQGPVGAPQAPQMAPQAPQQPMPGQGQPDIVANPDERQLQEWANEAIQQGADPIQVYRRMEEIRRGGAGGGTPRPFDASFDPISEIRSRYGVDPTSGYRTPGHQGALADQGLTPTRSGSHPRGDGVDWPTPSGMTKQQWIAEVERRYPGARAIPSNGNSIHVTFPGWGRAPDVSGSRRRYPSRGR